VCLVDVVDLVILLDSGGPCRGGVGHGRGRDDGQRLVAADRLRVVVSGRLMCRLGRRRTTGTTMMRLKTHQHD